MGTEIKLELKYIKLCRYICPHQILISLMAGTLLVLLITLIKFSKAGPDSKSVVNLELVDE